MLWFRILVVRILGTRIGRVVSGHWTYLEGLLTGGFGRRGKITITITITIINIWIQLIIRRRRRITPSSQAARGAAHQDAKTPHDCARVLSQTVLGILLFSEEVHHVKTKHSLHSKPQRFHLLSLRIGHRREDVGMHPTMGKCRGLELEAHMYSL